LNVAIYTPESPTEPRVYQQCTQPRRLDCYFPRLFRDTHFIEEFGGRERDPDESPAPGTPELSFVPESEFRRTYATVQRALANGEWKAATVLAGSAAEAMLLWAIRQRSPAEITSAVAAARASGDLTTNPDSNLDRWNLHEYIEVAAKLDIIKPRTAVQTRLAKDFRNFIHPGVAQRLGEKCDGATAFSAVAGMEHVVRDLT
jgi:hypothetical protein